MNKWLTSAVKAYTDKYGLTSNPIIYEVGSRDGHDGYELADRIYDGHDLWQDAEVVLFECNPPQIEIIKTNYPPAKLITSAISDKAGQTVEFAQLKGDKNVAGSSSMDLNRLNKNWVKDSEVIKVKTRRLDDVIEELGHQKVEIDIMKIDIEGYTYQALKSMGKYLRNVRVFHLETEIEGAARAETNLDVALFMQEHGYICTKIEYEWPPDIEDQVWVRVDS